MHAPFFLSAGVLDCGKEKPGPKPGLYKSSVPEDIAAFVARPSTTDALA